MANNPLPSRRADRELTQLGMNIGIARKRRQFTQQRLADGAGVSRTTVRRLERGDSGTSIGALAMVLLALGESGRLSALLEVGLDDIGIGLSVSELPQRVRTKGRRKSGGSAGEAINDGAADGEVF